MKQTKSIMGMPVTVEIVDKKVTPKDIQDVFDYFRAIDKRFSTYKKDSEVSKINRGEIKRSEFSLELTEVLKLSEQTKKQTKGYFDVYRNGYLDPSGMVKGWAIQNAAKLLKEKGFKNFYVDAGGDVAVEGFNNERKQWKIGIRNPFNTKEIVKIVQLSNKGVATSGNYERGEHIYNPVTGFVQDSIVSLTVIGPNILEADRFATAAYAMGKKGIDFIESQKDLEGYMIDVQGKATFTSGFEKFVC